MPFPKLTPLQSRFAASLLASFILLILYLTLTKPQFAYAAELDSRLPPDHNHPIVGLENDEIELLFEEKEETLSEEEEETHWNGNPTIAPRQGGPPGLLSNNAPQNKAIGIGQTQNWVFPQSQIEGPHGVAGSGLPSARMKERSDEDTPELKKRQNQVQIYITVNTCMQPLYQGTDFNTIDAIPPQLQLYISQSDSNKNPGINSDNSSQQVISFNGGYALATLEVNKDVYIGVSAPSASNFQGSWNYEIAASIDAPFHSVNTSASNLYFVDSDNHAALLITGDLTSQPSNSSVYQEWMNLNPPYGMFAYDQKNWSILGVSQSYCGLLNNVRTIANLQDVSSQNIATMTNTGLTSQPAEQFYITALNASTTYWGFLAMQGNSTASGSGVVGGGGTVWAPMNFTTKAENNCALLYNLSFCSEVAYAVPTNPNLFSPLTGYAALANIYDSYAAQMYQYFNYSLQQIPCNTTPSAQFSLASTCDDCAASYKSWLCAVTIPRCADYSDPSPWLQPRSVGYPFVNGSSFPTDSPFDQMLMNSVAANSSRNPLIDNEIQPGPYKEVLPCEDLCYDLVKRCPAALGFGCPLRGAGLEFNYGQRSSDGGTLTCSYLGAAYYLGAAGRTAVMDSKLLISTLGLVMVWTVWAF